MCGIAGILRWDSQKVSEQSIARFTDSMAHRGPDGRGIWINPKGNLALGHRRLSILDLSEAAAQPFHSADGRYTITYNGEIFNFSELKQELKHLGYSFKTESDTEVLLYSWIHWGQDCLFRFNGMWAFALWDAQEESLTLCRDRFGVKPIYYLNQPGKQFAFASETFAFRFLEGFVREPDSELLNIALQRVFALEGSGKTPFKDLQALPAGHWVTLKPGQDIRIVKWWDTTQHLVSVPETYDACVLHLRDLFADACKIRLRSDVPVATALSGGVDSSAVYAMVNTVGKQSNDSSNRTATDWQHAYTASFPGADTDETYYAHKVAEHYNGNIIDVLQSADSMADRIISDTKLFDSIYLSPVSVASDLYKAMFTDGIRVSLDGHGVDEMAYGYGHSVLKAWQEEMKAGNSQYAQDLEETYVKLFAPALRDSMRQALKDSLIQPIASSQPRSHLRKFYEESLPPFIREAYRSLRGSPKPIQPWTSPLLKEPVGMKYTLPEREQSLYLEFHDNLLPTLLRNFDRASMIASIESRMPFMDYRIVCFLFSLPREYKIGHGFTKRIIRDAVRPLLPPEVIDRTWKVGFNAPMTQWFSGPLKSWVQDTVNSNSFKQSAHWNGKIISSIVAQKYANNNWGQEECMQLWPYLSAHLLLEKI